jgi:hypothetical protein
LISQSYSSKALQDIPMCKSAMSYSSKALQGKVVNRIAIISTVNAMTCRFHDTLPFPVGYQLTPSGGGTGPARAATANCMSPLYFRFTKGVFIASRKDHTCSDIPGAPIARLHGVMDKTRCGESRLSFTTAPKPRRIELTTPSMGSK